MPTPPALSICALPAISRIALALCAAILGLSPSPVLRAQVHQMDAAPAGVVEAGLPLFEIRSAEMLGLGSSPTDLHVLPDGRVLVVSSQQLAFGDGARWEVFRQSARDEPLPARGVAVDENGQIFTAARRGFARIEFESPGEWATRVIAAWPNAGRKDRAIPRTCVQLPGQWIWHSSSGAAISWRPGEKPVVLGHAASIQHVFSDGVGLNDGGSLWLSDRADGSLMRLAGQAPAPASVRPGSVGETITCSLPLGPRRVLVGTERNGLQWFDGQTAHRFAPGGILADRVRINALCATEGGFYAAAVEDYGIAFFDAEGRIVQALDRSADHRLSHVRQLVAGPGGVVWALLGDGVAQIQFPSRVSYFESLIGTGTGTAHPFRHHGELWFTADGTIRRAIYDPTGRMTGLRVDTPAGRFAANATTAPGMLLTATDDGAYYRSPDGWVPFAPTSNHLRVLDYPPANGRWLYAATGELGWLRPAGAGIALEMVREPASHKVYDSLQDEDGSVWLEVGDGRFGRVRVEGGTPTLELFGRESGLPDNWGQLFRLDGHVRFNIGDRILKFEPARREFVPDTAFAREFPDITGVIGRPGVDSQGRLWLTTPAGIRVFGRAQDGWHDVHEPLPAGLLPYFYTFETRGVVWMHAEQRLARYDPAVPAPAAVPLRALITRVVLPASRREFLHPRSALPVLSYPDSSLVVHFAAPGHSWSSISFDVSLEGGRPGWVSAGSSGSAVFNHLREGNYLLRVRPRTGGGMGAEAALRITIAPPWYRTPYAYLAYWFSGVGLVLLSGRVFSFFQRRETTRLGRLVAERTRELNATNERLAAQVEEIRMLSQAIEQSPVAVLITAADGTIAFANPRACEMSGRAGAELVGANVRRLRLSAAAGPTESEIAAALQRGESWRGQLINQHKDGRLVHVRSAIAPVRGVGGEVRHHLVLEEDITSTIAENERRQKLEAQLVQAQKLESLGTLAGGIAHDFNNILTGMLGFCELAEIGAAGNPTVQRDLAGIRSAGLRAKDLVARILTFSRQSHGQTVTLPLREPVNEAMNLIRASAPATIELAIKLEVGFVRADSTQIQQIVLNLCTNAMHAIGAKPGRIEVLVESFEVDASLAAEVPRLWVGPSVRLVVTDNGAGMDQTTLDRIFDPFFTTKPLGVGTGLGLAIVQSIVAGHGGSMRVRSAPGAGTTFEIYFRRAEDPAAMAETDSPVPRGHDEEILVVDDERAVANFIAARLGHLGYRPVVYADAPAALEAFAARPERFQAIVTDLTMPSLTGADLIQRMRTRGWLVPAVIVTGHGGEAVRKHLQEFPRCLVVFKPFSGDDLGRALHQVISDYSMHPR